MTQMAVYFISRHKKEIDTIIWQAHRKHRSSIANLSGFLKFYWLKGLRSWQATSDAITIPHTLTLNNLFLFPTKPREQWSELLKLTYIFH